jgi:hypothetical protein
MKYSKINFIVIIIIILLIILVVFNKFYSKKESFKSGLTVYTANSISNNAIRQQNVDNANKSNSNNKNTCFSKDTLLQLENGKTIKISDAKIGDKILSYSKDKLIYSPIISIPHEKNNILSKFIEIKTVSGKNIKMTEFHLIPILKNNKFELIKADDLELNNIIMTIDGHEAIKYKDVIYDNGIYTVVTLEDYIIVNNIIASPFAISHLLASFYYKLHKMIYNIDPKILESSYFDIFNKTNIKLYNNIYDNIFF